MAKVVPSAIAGAYASTAELNANFAALAAEFENCLSLDGTSPSQMTSDLDMNNNDILNVNVLNFTGTSFNAVDVVVADVAGRYAATDAEAALDEVKLLADANKVLADANKVTADAAAAAIAALDVFTDFYAGFLNTGLQAVYAADLDSIVVTSRYSFIASGVTNEPPDMLSTEYGIVETMSRDGNDAVQLVYGQSGTAAGAAWVRVNTAGTWGTWAGFGSGGGGTPTSFLLMGG